MTRLVEFYDLCAITGNDLINMSTLFDFEYIIIDPKSYGSLSDQVKDCAQQSRLVKNELTDKAVLVRINWFFCKTLNSSCTQMQKLVPEAMEYDNLGNIPYTIVGERPCGEALVQLVLCFITGISGNASVESKSIGDNVYCRVKQGSQKWVFTGGTGCTDNLHSIDQSAHSAFREVKAILENEKLAFSNLVRQWNYIPGIVETITDQEGKISQNYQEFNNVRAAWYQKEGLEKDFPAATGIGVSGGAVNIEVVAVSPSEELLLLSLHNPEQSDAHKYSESKLIGRNSIETPRFERGKVAFANGNGHIWVSGTAAIRGEDSIPGDISEQSLITCQNIDALISQKNLEESGLPSGKYKIRPVYIRAYVKDVTYGTFVKDFLEKRYPEAPIHVLQADVCREELLVEVEGEFSIRQLGN